MSRTLVSTSGTDAGSLILLAYEDPEQSSLLVSWLARDGKNEVLTCPLARAATSLIEDVRPDLILLQAASNADLLVAACEDIRGVTERPVVVLSEITDALTVSRALDSGVDDYVPFGKTHAIPSGQSVSTLHGAGVVISIMSPGKTPGHPSRQSAGSASVSVGTKR